MVVTSLATAGGSFLTYFFSVTTDNCTGVALAPGANCTVTVQYTNVLAASGTPHAGTLTFTDTGAGGPQVENLIGIKTP
jgi:hypothetical protein